MPSATTVTRRRGETKEQAKARRDGKRFTLAEARDERIKARALVQQGINPAHNRQLDRIKREHDNATTFDAVAREWLALKDWEDVTKARPLDLLQQVIFPKIGALPVKQVTLVYVLDVLNATLKKNDPSVAAEAKRTMSAVFELAVSTLRAETDPVYLVRKALPANKTQHSAPCPPKNWGSCYENWTATAAIRGKSISLLCPIRPWKCYGPCTASPARMSTCSRTATTAPSR